MACSVSQHPDFCPPAVEGGIHASVVPGGRLAARPGRAAVLPPHSGRLKGARWNLCSEVQLSVEFVPFFLFLPHSIFFSSLKLKEITSFGQFSNSKTE